jgi:hypothetical protein
MENHEFPDEQAAITLDVLLAWRQTIHRGRIAVRLESLTYLKYAQLLNKPVCA